MKEKDKIAMEARLLRRISAVNQIPMTAIKIDGIDETHHCLSILFSGKKNNLGYTVNIGLDSLDQIDLVNNFRSSNLDSKLRI